MTELWAIYDPDGNLYCIDDENISEEKAWELLPLHDGFSFEDARKAEAEGYTCRKVQVKEV